MENSRQIAQWLLQIKAIKLSPQHPFTWASGLRSPIYCDNRLVLSHPAIRQRLLEAMVHMAADFGRLDGIAGVATAGIAHGALLAHALDLPFVYVRSQAKGHGRQNLIEGEVQPGGRYLVVEDLISTGGSCLQAVQALRAEGVEVAGVLAIFNYGFPAATAAFAAADCPWQTLSHYDALLAEAVSAGYLSADEQAALSHWRLDPKAWSDAFLADQGAK